MVTIDALFAGKLRTLEPEGQHHEDQQDCSGPAVPV